MAAELGLNVKLAKELDYYMILVKYQMQKVIYLTHLLGMQWAENMVKRRFVMLLELTTMRSK
jgi:hypothetical protein